MEVVLIKYKVREGLLERVREWVKYFNEHKNEIIKLLADEKMQVESAFLEATDRGAFIYYYMRAESLEYATNTFKNSENVHDHFHKKFLSEVLEGKTSLETLIDMEKMLT